MKKLLVGWHGNLYWSGMLWYTRASFVNRIKCVGSGKTIEEAQQDFKNQIAKARLPIG